MSAPDTACEDCREASQGMHHRFTRGCDSCRCRALARSPAFHASERAGVQTAPYRQLLQAGGVTHAEVLAAAAADWMRSRGPPQQPELDVSTAENLWAR